MVVGGGLLGTATAYHLVGAGARTLLVDRADVGRATDAGAGILSPETNSRDTGGVVSPWPSPPSNTIPRSSSGCAASRAAIPATRACGQLVVAVSDDEIAALRARQASRLRAPAAARPAHPRTSTRSAPPRRASCFPAGAGARRNLFARRRARGRPAPESRAAHRRRGPRPRGAHRVAWTGWCARATR